MAKRRRSKTKSHRKVSRRRRRRNGAGLGRTHYLALMTAGKRKKARKAPKRRRRAKARKSRAGKRIRPVIISSRGKYYRPRRSKYFKTARRVNGRRRRHARRHNGRSLVSSIKSVFQVRTISRYASIGGGIFAGTMFSRMLNTGLVPFTNIALPASITTTLAKLRPVHGLFHILAGSLLMAKVRNKYAQDVGVGLAALGGFDLLMQVLSRVGVKNLPTFSGMNVSLRGAGHSQYAGMSYPGGFYGAPKQAGMNVDLRSKRMAGYNVDLLGEARARDAENSHLADNINDMLG